MDFFRKLIRKLKRAISAFNDDDTPPFSSISHNISRENLKRNCRILFIDDENVDLISDLRKEGFSVDHDKNGNDVSNIERGYFDLVVLDYNGVGTKYGNDQGLSLLKAIKRVNKSVFVLSYTSQNLPPNKSSEFYTLCDGTLNKDDGVADSIKRIEDALRQAVQPERIWHGVLKGLNIEPNTNKAKQLEKQVVQAVLKSRRDDALRALGETPGSSENSLIPALIEKLIKFAIDRYMGT